MATAPKTRVKPRATGNPKRPVHEPKPSGTIDYDAVYDDVTQRFPKIMKRLGE
jgi:hypothetical protein